MTIDHASSGESSGESSVADSSVAESSSAESSGVDSSAVESSSESSAESPAERRARRDLIAAYQPGFALPAAFYADDAIYRRDLEAVFFRHWIYAAHVSQLPAAGCYRVVELGGESIILARARDDRIRAFANVCRHRGSRICAGAGKASALVCPYHGWTYGLDGELRSRRAMPTDFKRAEHALKAVRCEVFHGLIFINLDPNAHDLTPAVQALDSCLDVYQLAHAKVACAQTYAVEANWKLAVENFMECYHCAPAHAEYARRHALTSPDDNARLRPAMRREAKRCGFSLREVGASKSAQARARRTDATPHYYARNALYPPFATGSEDGAPLAPLLGEVADYGGGVADIQIGPVSFGALYADHAVLYRFVPRGAQATEMELVWLVAADAEPGADYDPDRLTWLWRVTSEADKQIIADNQRGINSRFYQPGPLSKMEAYTTDFIEWYLSQIA
ncbi:MAG: aromatic ring-hydroxylating oxygenase subunit alpha [bacterium]